MWGGSVSDTEAGLPGLPDHAPLEWKLFKNCLGRWHADVRWMQNWTIAVRA